jgi:putative peptide zinc metalloprotease protein
MARHIHRQRVFSESWHLVAARHAVLRPVIEARRQMFRGETWYVLYDPLRHEYFRVTDAGYAFIARLSAQRTIDQVWKACMEENPDNTPVQEEVIQLLAQLNQSNLLETDIPPDTAKLYRARTKMQEKRIRAQLLNFLFLRIPLFNPDPLLKPLSALVRPLCNLWGLGLWFIIALWGIKLLAENASALANHRQGLLAPGNVPWLLLATVGLKALHELAHGLVCRALGGPVHRFGLMLLLLVPLPYVDASSSWAFPGKWRRIAVASAGMMAELAVAAVALWVWSRTGDPAVKSLAFNVLVVATLGTILFNINPLLKFDGYYILSDWLGMPNLQQRAQEHLRYIGEHHLFGVGSAKSAARSLGEALMLTSYGVGALVYRIFLMTAIALTVAEAYFEIGLAIAAMVLITFFIVPLGKFIHYLAFSPRLEEVRGAAVLTVSVVILGLVTFLGAWPWPERFTAPGVIRAPVEQFVYAQASGWIDEVLVPSASPVQAGDVLMRLSNPELDLEIRAVESSVQQREMYYQVAQRQEFSSLEVWQATLRAERQKLALLVADRDNLLVRAPRAGIWFSPEMQHLVGRPLRRGEELGKLIEPGTPRFVTVVSQTEAARIFEQPPLAAEVRLHGRAATAIPATFETIIESGRRGLPSAALGWAGGGEVATSQEDQSGTVAAEAFFEIRLQLDPPQAFVAGSEQRGRARIVTGQSTLAVQMWRTLRQMLQRRLQI